jgi:hypothetical protein
LGSYNLCLAWNWEYDADFIDLLDAACRSCSISLLQVNSDNLQAALLGIYAGELHFDAFFDRASDADDNFNPLVEWAQKSASLHINDYRLARSAWDKTAMHRKVLEAGLEAPYTLTLPGYLEQADIPCPDLSPLGTCFAIKPAHGGGGLGVITDATHWDQVLFARQEFPDDQYLLQATVTPCLLDGRPAWFRMIYCAGEIFGCWWDPATHIYTPLEAAEQECYGLQALNHIPPIMAGISRLELFSTEIAYTTEGRFLVIDYVNDPIDLRPKSKAPEAVPDQVLAGIASRLACFVAERS